MCVHDLRLCCSNSAIPYWWGPGWVYTWKPVDGVITDLQPRWFWNTLGFTNAHLDTNVQFDDAVFQSLCSEELKLDKFNHQHRVHRRVMPADLPRSSTLVGNYWIRK